MIAVKSNFNLWSRIYNYELVCTENRITNNILFGEINVSLSAYLVFKGHQSPSWSVVMLSIYWNVYFFRWSFRCYKECWKKGLQFKLPIKNSGHSCNAKKWLMLLYFLKAVIHLKQLFSVAYGLPWFLHGDDESKI